MLMTREQIIERDEDVMGGMPVFAGTRVPGQDADRLLGSWRHPG